jgi:caa(3)-type oxidase subunit IV
MAAHGSVFQRIWVPFFILLGITILEFAVAFGFDKSEYGTFRLWVFLLMTLAKAFYIVAYFMHLKFERINLIYTIVLPMAFIVYLLVLLFQEGGVVYRMIHGATH